MKTKKRKQKAKKELRFPLFFVIMKAKAWRLLGGRGQGGGWLRLEGYILMRSCRLPCLVCRSGWLVDCSIRAADLETIGNPVIFSSSFSLSGALRGKWRWYIASNVHLFSSENQPLLDWWDSFLLLDSFLYARDLCRRDRISEDRGYQSG